MIARMGRVAVTRCLAALLVCWVATATPAMVRDAAAAQPAAQRPIEPGEAVPLRLKDGTQVTVIREEASEEAEDASAHAYRYLPANLTLAQRRDGAAEFSFLPYRRDEKSEIEGGIMHLLLRWGLSEAQVADLQRALRREVDARGTVVGAAPVQPWSDGRSWEITSRSTLGSILNRSLSSAGGVPTEPGSKLAMSFRFDGADAARIEEMLRGGRRAWKDRVRFQFAVGGPLDGVRRDGVRRDGVRRDGAPSDGAPSEGAPDWVLERDLASLFPVGGSRD